jgi:hypothetical protein
MFNIIVNYAYLDDKWAQLVVDRVSAPYDKLPNAEVGMRKFPTRHQADNRISAAHNVTIPFFWTWCSRARKYENHDATAVGQTCHA